MSGENVFETNQSMLIKNKKEIGNRGYYQHRIKTEDGSASFYYMPMPSNCGILLVFSLGIYGNTKEGELKLQQLVHNLLMEHSHKNKIVMTDRENGHIDKFCRAMGWHKGPSTYNNNSGNDVYVYEMSREKILGKDIRVVS